MRVRSRSRSAPARSRSSRHDERAASALACCSADHQPRAIPAQLVADMTDPRRRVPSVDAVLRAAPADAAERRRLVPAVRAVLADARAAGREILDAAAYAKLAREQ